MFKNKGVFALNLVFLIFVSLYFFELKSALPDGKIKGLALQPWFTIVAIITLILDIIWLFKLKIKWLQNLLTAVIMLVLCFSLLEWACGILYKNRLANENKIKITGPNYAIEKDSVVGYTLPADTTLIYQKYVNDSSIYNTTVTTNRFGLRICTKLDTTQTLATKHALFFGCSFTLGEGLNGNETLEYNFEQKNKGYQSYNFGLSGYGPQQNLARLERGKIENIVTQKKGIAIYTYIPDHMRRAVPGATGYFMHGGVSPDYAWEGESLKYIGFSKNTSLWRKFLYEVVLNTNIFKFFNISYPFYYNQKDRAFIAQMLKQMEIEYLKKFDGKFYVLLYPSTQNYNELIVELKARNINYLDYSKLVNFDDPKYVIKYDNHPRAITNKIVMDKLCQDIDLSQ